jgi:hypothetical protein
MRKKPNMQNWLQRTTIPIYTHKFQGGLYPNFNYKINRFNIGSPLFETRHQLLKGQRHENFDPLFFSSIDYR